MDNKVYVGNLPYSVRDDDLHQLFEAYGQIRFAKVMMDRDTGRSKGFGFVEMDDAAQAKAAIDALSSHAIEGRNLVINVARPREAGARPARPDAGGYRPRY